MVAFATLPAQFRTDGTSLLSLFRNVGSAIGLSIDSALLARNQQVVHSELAAHVTPFNRALQTGPDLHAMLDATTRHGAALLDSIINRQATIIAYIDDFRFMMLSALPTFALLLLMRRPARAARADPAHAAMD